MVRSHWLRVCAARLVALFRLAFTPAPGLPSLSLAAQRNSQAYSTKDTPQTLCVRDILPVHGFRFCFTPLGGVLFAFPSRYFSSIGSALVFSLGSWSTRIQTGFLVPRPTQVPHHGGRFIPATGLSPSSAELSGSFAYEPTFSLHGSSPCGPSTPPSGGLGSSAFARRYLRNLF